MTFARFLVHTLGPTLATALVRRLSRDVRWAAPGWARATGARRRRRTSCRAAAMSRNGARKSLCSYVVSLRYPSPHWNV
eukprot:1472952-Pleurochrysis_carterae.AAC.1